MIMAIALIFPQPTLAVTAAEIDREVDVAVEKLYRQGPAAKDLAKVAKGVLIFPDVVKAGLLIGGKYGQGALRKKGKTVGYYKNDGGFLWAPSQCPILWLRAVF